MSEQFKQDQGSQSLEINDDPLAELARIVAGEPELNSPASEQQASIPQPPLEASSMEAALEEQLLAELSMNDAAEIEMATPAFVEDINASIEQITAEDVPTEVIHPEPEFEASVAQSYQVEAPISEPVVNQEVGFQDGLISALEMEIVGEPEPEALVETAKVQEIAEEHIEVVAEETVAQVEQDAANMQETLEQELAAQMEPMQASFDEPAIAPPVMDQPVASIDEDLGAAFANEFEQMSVEQTQPITQEFVVETPVAETPLELQTEVAQPQVVSDAADIEMDFEAAFTQELEGVEVPETQGWSETETAEASAAFNAAVAAEAAPQVAMHNETNLDAMEYDPGHVGSVDEIAAVEASAAVANDNGGGKKYAVAALVIALFAGAIAAGYGFLGGENATVASGTPEIIKADADPA